LKIGGPLHKVADAVIADMMAVAANPAAMPRGVNAIALLVYHLRQVEQASPSASGGAGERLADQLAHAIERVSRASAKTQHEDSELHVALGDLYGCGGRAISLLRSARGDGS